MFNRIYAKDDRLVDADGNLICVSVTVFPAGQWRSTLTRNNRPVDDDHGTVAFDVDPEAFVQRKAAELLSDAA